MSNSQIIELQQQHHDYVNLVTEAGIPVWQAELYGYGPDLDELQVLEMDPHVPPPDDLFLD